MNNDGVPDDGKVWWPRADLNGSGLASFDTGDQRPVCNAMRTDLDIIKLAWQDQSENFDTAMTELKLTNPSTLPASAPAGAATRSAHPTQTRGLTDARRNACAPAN